MRNHPGVFLAVVIESIEHGAWCLRNTDKKRGREHGEVLCRCWVREKEDRYPLFFSGEREIRQIKSHWGLV